MTRVPTRHTPEGQAVAVGPLGMPASGASLRGVPGLYPQDRHALGPGLVLDERSQAVEAPAVQAVLEALVALALARALPDALEVFDGDDQAALGLGKGHNPLAGHVVHIAPETPLFPAQPFPSPTDRPGGLSCLTRLEGAAGVEVVRPSRPDLAPSDKERSLLGRCHGDVLQALVNADDGVVGLVLRLDLAAVADGQVDLLPPHEQVEAAESGRALPVPQLPVL